MTYQEYQQLTPEQKQGWDESKAYARGRCVALTLVKGCEIHIIPIENKKMMTRKNIKAHLKPLLERYGMVTTRYPINEGIPRLMHKLGFERTWDDGVMSYWMLTQLPYEAAI